MGVPGPQVLTGDRGHRSRNDDCDVVVVGGGPAGLIAARELATAGVDVRVLEEHGLIGAPVHCTGVLGLAAFDELNLSRRAIVGAADAARFVAPNGSIIDIGVERVRAAIVDRAIFDRDLAASAVAAGATIRTGARVVSIAREQQSVTITSADASGVTDTVARAAVLACGASYRFNRALGLGVPSVLVHSAQLEVAFPPIDRVQVHFGRKIAPGGFAWVVPFEREGTTFARVGLLCDRDAGARFQVFAESIRAAHHLPCPWPRAAAARAAARSRGTDLDRSHPRRRRRRRPRQADDRRRHLLRPADGSPRGRCTGRGAVAKIAWARARLKEYERRWRARLGPEIRAGLAFRAVAARLNDGAVDRLIELARVDGIVPLLTQTADFNWHHTAARALLRHAKFRRIVLESMWN